METTTLSPAHDLAVATKAVASMNQDYQTPESAAALARKAARLLLQYAAKIEASAARDAHA